MDLQINNQTLLKDIHHAFQKEFPFLDLAFFSIPHETGEASPKNARLPLTLSVGEAGDAHKIGAFVLQKSFTVKALEDQFENQFGLHCQVLKRSGKLWLQSTTSDNKALETLNTEVENAHLEEPMPAEEVDYHEQE